MKRKQTPPSAVIIRELASVSGSTRGEVQSQICAVLAKVRYAGDLKQLAERYGLHYLKSKRMRLRELHQWIVDNHPQVKEAEKQEDVPHVSALRLVP